MDGRAGTSEASADTGSQLGVHTQSTHSESSFEAEHRDSIVSNRSDLSRNASTSVRRSVERRSTPASQRDELAESESEAEDADDDDIDTGGVNSAYNVDLSYSQQTGSETMGIKTMETENIPSTPQIRLKLKGGILERVHEEKRPSLLERQPGAKKITFESQSQSQSPVTTHQASLVSSSEKGENLRNPPENRHKSPSKTQNMQHSPSPTSQDQDAFEGPQNFANKVAGGAGNPRTRSSPDDTTPASDSKLEKRSRNLYGFGGFGSSISSSKQPTASSSTVAPLSHAQSRPSESRPTHGWSAPVERHASDSIPADSSPEASGSAKRVASEKGKAHEQAAKRVADEDGGSRRNKRPTVPAKQPTASSDDEDSESDREREYRPEEMRAQKNRKKQEARELRSTEGVRKKGGNLYFLGRNTPGGRVSWTSDEERLLLKCIEAYGTDWKKMIALHGEHGTVSTRFKDRTNVSLKDKAVNMKKNMIKAGQPIPETLNDRVKVPISKLTRQVQAFAPPTNETDSEDNDE